LALGVHCPPTAMVESDPVLLEDLVRNLVDNAINYTSQGRVDVVVLPGDEVWDIEVRDTGCGMSEQFIRERLFRPFESTKNMGMGIGTYESREYVRQLGGEILVDSIEGQGTTFLVRLPLSAAANGVPAT